MALPGAKSRTILQRQLEAREKLWPGITSRHLWYRKERDGFVTVSRLMPLIMNIMDELAGKGNPVGQTYFELWCRLHDEGFLTLNRAEEMAFHTGFTGQRAVRTWKDRVRRLRGIGFVDIKEGPLGELSYALFWNPLHVIKRAYIEGLVPERKWQALVIRANEVGAKDFDDIADDGSLIAPPPPPAPPPPLPPPPAGGVPAII
jgi:hypothetical protein